MRHRRVKVWCRCVGAVLRGTLALVLVGGVLCSAGPAQAAATWSAPLPVDPTFGMYEHVRGSISCASESFCVAVSEEGDAESFNGVSWSKPSKIDEQGRLRSVSCASSSFCAAVDDRGDALVFNGIAWGAPAPIARGDEEFESVSCSSSSFCVAVSHASQYVVFNGSSWSSPHELFEHAVFEDTQVSCVSSSFCVAEEDDGQAATFNGTKWSRQPAQIGEYVRGPGPHVSCASASFCLVLRGSLKTYATFKRGRWSKTHPIPVGKKYVPESISCPSTTFCLATARGPQRTSETIIFNGSTWSEPLETSGVLGVVSCASSSFCVAADGQAGAAVFNGSSWSARSVLGGGSSGMISCASESFCVSLDGNDRAVTYREGAWSVQPTDDEAQDIKALSCPASSFCMGVGGLIGHPGEAVGFDGTSWSAPMPIQGVDPHSVSCTASSFCVAAGLSDTVGISEAVAFNGSSWSEPVSIGVGSASVSCASSAFCLAVGEDGRVATFNGSSWSEPHSVGSELSLRAVSCVSAEFCAAVSEEGYVVTLTDEAADASSTQITRSPLRGVSCPSASFCVAVDEEGGALTFDGSGWSQPVRLTTIDDGPLTAVSCPSSSFCVADDAAGDVMIGPGEWPGPNELPPPEEPFCAQAGVEGLSPTTGPATGGTTVTIAGMFLSCVTAVHFGANEAIIKSKGETFLTVETPAGKGTVHVTVTDPVGTTERGETGQYIKFTYKG